MSRKRTQQQYTPDAVVTVDGKTEYPIDFVREFYINSDKTIEEMAIQLNLPVEIIQQHARAGLRSWYKLKEDKLQQRLQYFMSVNIDNLVETHSLLEDGHFLQIVQMKSMQQFLQTYYAANGHLFAMDQEGAILKDAFGLPIPLPLPNDNKSLVVMEMMLKLKETTKASLNDIYEATKKPQQAEVVDLDKLEVFSETND